MYFFSSIGLWFIVTEVEVASADQLSGSNQLNPTNWSSQNGPHSSFSAFALAYGSL